VLSQALSRRGQRGPQTCTGGGMSWFVLCCCKPFLQSRDDDRMEFYNLLDLEKVSLSTPRVFGLTAGNGIHVEGPVLSALPLAWKGATTDDIKRAYKKKSLLMHPDKLAQRGQTLTAEDQARVRP
jgi:hypothetical protein